MQEKILDIDYKPAKTLEELKQQRIKERLNHTPMQSFHILMGSIRISEKVQKAKITYVFK